MALNPCLYRQERPLPGAHEVEIVCLAGGNHRLGIKGRDPAYLEKACGDCPVPDALADEDRTCLYLLPLRIFGDSGIETLYHCRWLYKLNPKRVNRLLSLHFPRSCEWWFPHPIKFLPPGTEWHTLRAWGLYLGTIEGPEPLWRWSAPDFPEYPSGWRRL